MYIGAKVHLHTYFTAMGGNFDVMAAQEVNDSTVAIGVFFKFH